MFYVIKTVVIWDFMGPVFLSSGAKIANYRIRRQITLNISAIFFAHATVLLKTYILENHLLNVTVIF